MNADKGGEGVKKSENSADVICVWPLKVFNAIWIYVSGTTEDGTAVIAVTDASGSGEGQHFLAQSAE